MVVVITRMHYHSTATQIGTHAYRIELKWVTAGWDRWDIANRCFNKLVLKSAFNKAFVRGGDIQVHVTFLKWLLDSVVWRCDNSYPIRDMVIKLSQQNFDVVKVKPTMTAPQWWDDDCFVMLDVIWFTDVIDDVLKAGVYPLITSWVSPVLFGGEQ